MPFATTATMAGAAMGFGTQLFINSLRKLPLLRSACPSFPPPRHSFFPPRATRARGFVHSRASHARRVRSTPRHDARAVKPALVDARIDRSPQRCTSIADAIRATSWTEASSEDILGFLSSPARSRRTR
jgi:hypothetical protein